MHDITLEMCQTEITRLYKSMKKTYPNWVKDGIITPYTRDHRLAVMEKMIRLFEEAQENRNTGGPTFKQLIKNLPDASTKPGQRPY